MPRIASHLASRLAVLTLAAAFAAPLASAQPDTPFRFESVASLEAMQALIRTQFPPGATKAMLHRTFVDEGGGSLRQHPRHANTEKVLYDINLCSLYVWRWNISADYDDEGHLLQAYVNGEPVHASGPQKKDAKMLIQGDKGKILRVTRPRPEASKGEKVLVYLLLDGDGNTATLDDQLATGGGPSRPNPIGFGKLIAYTNVDPWRSIFDADPADRIVDYQGMCPPPQAPLSARAPAPAPRPGA
jgi:hypothetical protein